MQRQVISATVLDEDFLNAIKAKKIELFSGKQFKAIIRKRENKVRSYNVLKVFI